MKSMLKMLAGVLLSMAMFPCASIAQRTAGTNQIEERNRLYGVGEPITSSFGNSDTVNIALDKIEAVGFTAVREWMHITNILADPKTPKPGAVAMYNKTLDRLKKMNVEITGMSHIGISQAIR